MSAKLGSTVPSEADQFVATLKAARIPEKYEDALWDVWVDDPPRATRMARAYTPPVRTKAAPGMQSIELPAALAMAITAARAKWGDKQVEQVLGGASPVDAVMAELSGKTAGVGTLTSDEKPISREAKARMKEQRKGMAALFDEGIQEYNR